MRWLLENEWHSLWKILDIEDMKLDVKLTCPQWK